MKLSNEELIKLYGILENSAKNLLRFRRGSLRAIGKEPCDYASEAFLRYLEEPKKFIPEKGRTLPNYLIFHIMRHLISDDYRDRKRDKDANAILKFKHRDELTEALYILDVFLDDEIDFDNLVAQVLEKLKAKGDDISIKVYEAKFINLMKNADICAEFNLTSNQVNNSIGRIHRVLDEVVAQNRLKK
jgi:DNA-directed RNA polymerase specialized sigma24 family protein